LAENPYEIWQRIDEGSTPIGWKYNYHEN
jgi:hypothetical protein